MYWQEKSASDSYSVPDTVVDLIYKIECKALPIDHAWALSKALTDRLPWLKTTQNTAIHLIHGAESGNGWIRPSTTDDGSPALIHLSRRARFHLRIHKDNLALAKELLGLKLNIAGHALQIKEYKQLLLAPQTTLFSRYMHCDQNQSEEAFLDQIAPKIQTMGIKVRKMLGGKQHQFNTPNGIMHTRSLMLAELEKEESTLLQQQGLGEQQLLGMGIFLPHRGIAAVTEINDDLSPLSDV